MSKLFTPSREGQVVQVHGLAPHKLLSSSPRFLIFLFLFCFLLWWTEGIRAQIVSVAIQFDFFLIFSSDQKFFEVTGTVVAISLSMFCPFLITPLFLPNISKYSCPFSFPLLPPPQISNDSCDNSAKLRQPTLMLLASLLSHVTDSLEGAAEKKSLLLHKVNTILILTLHNFLTYIYSELYV